MWQIAVFPCPQQEGFFLLIEVVCHLFFSFSVKPAGNHCSVMDRRREGGEKKGGWGCRNEKPSDFGSGREGGADELQARVIAKLATVGRKGRDLRVFFFLFAAIEMQCTKKAKNKKALKASAARRTAHSNRVISSSDDF